MTLTLCRTLSEKDCRNPPPTRQNPLGSAKLMHLSLSKGVFEAVTHSIDCHLFRRARQRHARLALSPQLERNTNNFALLSQYNTMIKTAVQSTRVLTHNTYCTHMRVVLTTLIANKPRTVHVESGRRSGPQQKNETTQDRTGKRLL